MDPTFTYPGDTASVSPILAVVYVLVFLAIYGYFAYSLMVISKKTNTPHPWMSWIPVLNLFQLIKAAGKSYWWILLMIVPFVNIFASVYIWMEIARRRGFPNWMGLLMIIPIANLILPGYFAFAEPTKKV